jgi:hypothetical protein
MARIFFTKKKGVILLMTGIELGYFTHEEWDACNISYLRTGNEYLRGNWVKFSTFRKKCLKFKSEFVCDINAISSSRN